MKNLPKDTGPVFIRISEYAEEMFELDSITCHAAPNILPLDSKEELVKFLEEDHVTKTFIWNNDDGQTVGYLSYIEQPDDEGAVELLNLIVLPSFWRQGYGRQIVNYYLELMKDKGFKKSKLVTSPENNEARAFYKKVGYKEKGLLKDYYGPGEDRVLMYKEIG